jgi:hypothetical protein
MSGVCDPSGDALTFPVGAVLLTGTSIVPGRVVQPPAGRRGDHRHSRHRHADNRVVRVSRDLDQE